MSEVRQRILVVDDDAQILAGLGALLSDDWEVRTAGTGKQAIVAFGEFSPDAVLLDVELPDFSGVDLLNHFKEYAETCAVIMMSGAGDLERVVTSMKLGAETFLQKPFDYETLCLTLQQATKIAATKRELAALQRRDAEAADRLPGVSDAVRRLNEIVPQISAAPSPVLIEGESGTGKGVLARLIHNSSPRARAPFVDLNCAGLSKELLESELFGHERGAFTSATNTKQGLFEIAGDGTLFLDEIGEMETAVQARLLKALEDKRFRRVGGTRDIRADFRLIAATNRDLHAEVKAGRFRNDLYYRLNVVKLRMPALRERLEDVEVLVQELLRSLSKELGRPQPSVSPRALKKLASQPWPGNVRELRNVLERSLLTLRGREIAAEDLHLGTQHGPESGASGELPANEWEIQPLDRVITRYVAASVEAAKGNVRKAARQLQISPSTLYARLKAAETDAE
jgi:DNA-binding NtrC family response regulator